jgi:hypothetical protein
MIDLLLLDQEPKHNHSLKCVSHNFLLCQGDEKNSTSESFFEAQLLQMHSMV